MTAFKKFLNENNLKLLYSYGDNDRKTWIYFDRVKALADEAHFVVTAPLNLTEVHHWLASQGIENPASRRLSVLRDREAADVYAFSADQESIAVHFKLRWFDESID